MQPHSQDTPCGLDLGGVITFFPIIYFMIDNMDYIKMAKLVKILN